jgi:hypothetical protein
MKKITIDNKTIEISDEFYEVVASLIGLQGTDMISITYDKLVEMLLEMGTKNKVKDEGDDEEWPQRGDNWYCINSRGGVSNIQWDDDDQDQFCKSTGNCYRTAEEAEEAQKTGWVAYLQALERVKKYIKDNGLEFEPDWSNFEQAKWHIFYSHLARISTTVNYDIQPCSLPCFSTEEHARQVMKACEADYLILLGVKR